MQDFRRAKTAYDLYGENANLGGSIQHLPEIPSAEKLNMPTDDYFEQMGSIHPLAGSVSARGPPPPGSHFPRPRTRAIGTPRGSALDVGIQADLPSMSMGHNDNPFTSLMDPVNQQYYYREWTRKPPSPRRPIYRSGRLGSPWRHVRSCINNGGNHLVFIDGTVKTEENFFYPPEDALKPPDLSIYVSPRFVQRSRGASLNTTFNDRAKQGFQYWYKDPKPINLSSKYNFGGGGRWLGVSGESLAARNPRFAVRY